VSTTPEPVPLNSHQQHTLEKILQHPVSHNIEWTSVLSLLEAIGSVKQTHDDKFVITVGAQTLTIEHPQNKDIDTELIVDLRRLFTNAGYGPDPG